MKRIFELDGLKPTTAQFAVELDLSAWLGTETISTVTYSAKCLEDDSVATTTVLDSTKHSNTTTTVKPWIKAGTSRKTYLVKMTVTGSAGSIEIFGLQFGVFDY